MTKEAFLETCRTVFGSTDGGAADIPGAGHVVFFDEPLIGFAAADDALFEEYLKPEVIGENFLTPAQWLPSARTVVSFFFPFSERVRSSNRAHRAEPSPEWLYARIEGQAFITRVMTNLQRLLGEKGIEACVPGQDERFGVRREPTSAGGAADFHADSRWSERHAAYACALGTFGLSRGLITEKGTAGRFSSILVSEEWPATARRYTGIYDYCIRCLACAQNCPARAISAEHGKNNVLCGDYTHETKIRYAPRYGCGKCQVGVPCESRAPGMKGGA